MRLRPIIERPRPHNLASRLGWSRGLNIPAIMRSSLEDSHDSGPFYPPVCFHSWPTIKQHWKLRDNEQESWAIAKMTTRCALCRPMGPLKNFGSLWVCPWLLSRIFLRAFAPTEPINMRTKFEVRSFTRSWDNRYPKIEHSQSVTHANTRLSLLLKYKFCKRNSGNTITHTNDRPRVLNNM